ncbi:MAG: phage integrase N-terminal SAM-like domain-containing protein [Planctomycetota bacterium]
MASLRSFFNLSQGDLPRVDCKQSPKYSPLFDGMLYQRRLEDLKLAGLAKRTVHGYLRAVRQLADFARRQPNKITEAQLRAYFIHLQDKNSSPTAPNVSPIRGSSFSSLEPASGIGSAIQTADRFVAMRALWRSAEGG